MSLIFHKHRSQNCVETWQSLRHLLAEDVPLELEVDGDWLFLCCVVRGGRLVLVPLLLAFQGGLGRLFEAFAINAHLELSALDEKTVRAGLYFPRLCGDVTPLL